MLYKCRYCGWGGPKSDFEIDHDPPLSRLSLATLLLPKLEWVCSGCNRQKGTMTASEYLFWRLINWHKANRGPIEGGE